MPCTCKILYRDNNNILLKYQHGCPEHEDWCRDESHRRYVRATDNVLMCECGRRAFIEEAVHSTSNNTSSPKELCPKCKSIYIWGSINGKKRWCDCGHKWSA